MKHLFLSLIALVAAAASLSAQTTYTSITDFESGTTNATVLWSGSAAVVTNSTGESACGNKVLKVTDTEGWPFVNFPISFASGKTWTDYDGIEMSVYPIAGTITTNTNTLCAGLDLSLLKKYEDMGVVYKDASGNAISDVITWLVQEKGVNAVRIRLFVDPTNDWAQLCAGGSAYVNQLGGDLATVKILGKRVKDAGAKFLLDIMYSDGWADPGQYLMPKRWATHGCGYSHSVLRDSMYHYTKDVLNAMVAYGATPDYVQVGNEISYGMFFSSYDSPTGSITKNGTTLNYGNYTNIHCHVDVWNGNTWDTDTYWYNFAEVLKSGIAAVREVCPSAKVVIHNERSGAAQWTVASSGTYSGYYPAPAFFKKLDYYLGNISSSYDIMGLSYYPEDHGKMDAFETVLSQMEAKLSHDIFICEYGYSNEYKRYDDDSSRYPSTIGYYKRGTTNSCPQAQKEFIQAMVTKCKSHRVKGMFYWFAEENEGSGVSGPYASGWRNTGLWANMSSTETSNTGASATVTAGCALPGLDVIGNFTNGTITKTPQSAYFAKSWWAFYKTTSPWTNTQVALNEDNQYGIDYTTSGLNKWYTVRFAFNTDSIAYYRTNASQTPTSINFAHQNSTVVGQASSFYLDNIRFYKTITTYYDVKWYADGTLVKSDNVLEGSAITLPTNPSNCSSTRKFVGWTAIADYEGDAAPSDLFTTSPGNAAEDVTYYAVYATTSTGTATTTVYKRATTLTSGKSYIFPASQTAGASTYMLPIASLPTTNTRYIDGTAVTLASDGSIAYSATTAACEAVYDGTNFTSGSNYLSIAKYNNTNGQYGIYLSTGYKMIYDETYGLYRQSGSSYYRVYLTGTQFTGSNTTQTARVYAFEKQTQTSSGTVLSDYSTSCSCFHLVKTVASPAAGGTTSVVAE